MRLITLVTLLGLSAGSLANTGYYRDPSLHNDTLTFTAEGDIWVYQLGQQSATRLTTHPAEERESAISQDGKSIAFVANYEGTNEVYVMPVNGGSAKRISFENSAVKVHGWTPEGHVVFATMSRVGPTGNWTLKTVDPNTLISITLPVADAVEGVVDNSNELYFVQFGLQVSNDNARYYRGGAQGELWRFDLNDDREASLLTGDHDASVREPMRWQDTLYFISNENGNDNIWQMTLSGKRKKALTTFTDYPIRDASLSNGKIAFQHGADIKVLDLRDNSITTLPIHLTSDFPHKRDKWLTTPTKYMTNVGFSGQQKQAVITARGQIAVASSDGRRLKPISTPAQSRSRKAILSHDGKWVYAINDASGEMEIWQFAADGSDEQKQLTQDATVSRWNLVLSPDGKYIAHDDFNGDLWLLNLETLENRKVFEGQSEMSPYANVVWSRDSRLLALTVNTQGNQRSRLYLLDTQTDDGVLLTSDKYNSYSPAFSANGDWLYFLSDRAFTPTTRSPWGDRNMGTSFDNKTLIYAYALKQDAEFPFQQPNELAMLKDEPEADDAEPESDETAAEDNGEDEATETEDTTPDTVVDWQGLSERLWQVPAKADNYTQLRVNNKYLFVSQREGTGNKTALKAIRLSPKNETSTVVSPITGFDMSPDGKQLLVLKPSSNNDQIYVVPAGKKFPSDSKPFRMNVKDWQLRISPEQEWQQLFHDAWLMHRDFFYDKAMRGVDWPQAKAKYAPLLARITDRYELNDVLAQLIGELNVLHSQVYGGDVPDTPDRPKPASLGAMLTQTAQGVVIEHIYQYDTELPANASPLQKPGTNAQNGDIIQAINGREVKDIQAVHNALLNQAGKQVVLTLLRDGESHHTVTYPISNGQAFRLRYQDWVTSNRKKVTAQDDDIGYMHIYAMGSNDVSEFAREFYAANQKGGLIIDVRRNRGGNIDSWLIEKLLRRVWMFWTIGNADPSTNMQQTFRGHLVVLADQYTYSDGETFTAAVKSLELGPVIGKQTAGAGIWLRGLNRLADNGMARVAELPVFDMEGNWVVEGHGVSPNVEVDNLPHATFNGQDAQLEAAVKYLKKQLRKKPVKPLKPKAYPAVDEPAKDVK